MNTLFTHAIELDVKVERDTLAADHLAADTEIHRLIDVSFVIIFYYR